MLKQILLFLLVATLWIPLTGPADGAENKGAEKIIISGGKRGDVSFPHRRHQDTLKDCNVCHVLFPQLPRSIHTQKEAGKLTNKQVMNKLCVKCHRAKRQAGDPSGPTSCNACHDQE